MTHSEVKKVIEWLAQTGYIQISINPKHVEIIANDFIEAHPTTRPQDLRERARKDLETVPVSCDDNGDNWYLEKYVVDTMLQFASAVLAEKDEELNRWRNAHHKITTQDVELRETIYHLQNRNAELEAEVERLKEIEFRYNSVNK